MAQYSRNLFSLKPVLCEACVIIESCSLSNLFRRRASVVRVVPTVGGRRQLAVGEAARVERGGVGRVVMV